MRGSTRLRPVLPQKVGEGLHQDGSDQGVVLWPHTIGGVPLAQSLEHIAEPVKPPEPRQQDEEADHEQEHLHMNGHTDPRCWKGVGEIVCLS